MSRSTQVRRALARLREGLESERDGALKLLEKAGPGPYLPRDLMLIVTANGALAKADEMLLQVSILEEHVK